MSDGRGGPRLLSAAREVMAEVGAGDAMSIRPFEVMGRRVHLRTLGAERLLAIMTWRRANPRDNAGLAARMIAASVVSEGGDPLLTVEAAGDLPGAVATLIFDEVVRRNGM